MPRGKTKASTATGAKHKNNPLDIKKTEDNDMITEEISKMKQEPLENKTSLSISNLSKFKFEKKPHVKIEFEKDSPEKEESTKESWEPSNWKDFLVNLRIMRANNDAPVDSMGCKSSIDKKATPEVYRYQSLISLMLSSQTKDQVTFAAMEKLRARGLTIDNVLNMSDEELGQLIYPVGFWKTKVKYIKKTTQTLKDLYNSDIPDSVEKLCKLTGVGPKMAHICMKVAWNKVTGIGVDTHVHRISNRIGWVKKPTTTPEDTRKALESWLPVDLWSEVNHLMVGFGQTICTPISPFCNECLNRDICPSSGKGRKSPSKRTPIKLEVKDESNSEDEFVNNSTGKTQKKRITPKKVQPLQLDAKLEVNNLKQKESKKSPSPKKELLEAAGEIKIGGISHKQKALLKDLIDNSGEEMGNFLTPHHNIEKGNPKQKTPRKDLVHSNGNKIEHQSNENKGRKSPQSRTYNKDMIENIEIPRKENVTKDVKPKQKMTSKIGEDIENVEMKKIGSAKKGEKDAAEIVQKKTVTKSPLKRKSPRNKPDNKNQNNESSSEEGSKKKSLKP